MVGSGIDISKQKRVTAKCGLAPLKLSFLRNIFSLSYQKPKIQNTVFSDFPVSANRLG